MACQASRATRAPRIGDGEPGGSWHGPAAPCQGRAGWDASASNSFIPDGCAGTKRAGSGCRHHRPSPRVSGGHRGHAGAAQTAPGDGGDRRRGGDGHAGTCRTLLHTLPLLPRDLRQHLSLHAMARLLREPPGTVPPPGAHAEVGAPRWDRAGAPAPTVSSDTGCGCPDTRFPPSCRRWAGSWCWRSRIPCDVWCSLGTWRSRRTPTRRWVLHSMENGFWGCPHPVW